MIYGYARVSTTGQAKDGNSIEAQEMELRAHGAEDIRVDVFSGATIARPEMERLVREMKSGDTLLATKLDRIARSVVEGCTLIQHLIDNGIIVHILNMGIIDTTPNGKLLMHVMLAFAEFERDLIRQRTQEGKAIAKLNPAYKDGRPHKYSKAQINHALELLETHSYSQVAELTGISKATLVRARKAG